MEIVVVLGLLFALVWFVFAVRRAGKLTDALNESKDRAWERAVRKAFIENPRGEFPALIDFALDDIAKTMVIHDRAGARNFLRAKLPEQVSTYRELAQSLSLAALKGLPPDATLGANRASLAAHVSGEAIDQFADQRSEHIDDAIGLRAALIHWSSAGCSGCPKCDRLWRGEPTCGTCGHVFEPASMT